MELKERNLERKKLGLISNEPTDKSQIKRTENKYFECYKYESNYVIRREEEVWVSYQDELVYSEEVFYPVLGTPKHDHAVTTYREHPFTSLMDAMLWVVCRNNEDLNNQ